MRSFPVFNRIISDELKNEPVRKFQTESVRVNSGERIFGTSPDLTRKK